jgi:hypothetical protein
LRRTASVVVVVVVVVVSSFNTFEHLLEGGRHDEVLLLAVGCWLLEGEELCVSG